MNNTTASTNKSNNKSVEIPEAKSEACACEEPTDEFMKNFIEFHRIAIIAQKYWGDDYKFTIALGMLMIKHKIRNAFLFHNLDASLIPAFLNVLNHDIPDDKKYNVVITNQYVSHDKIDTSKHTTGEILSYTHPEWTRSETNYKLILVLIGKLDNNERIYTEVAGCTPRNKDELEKKLLKFIKFTEKLALNCRITFTIETKLNELYIHKKLLTLFTSPGVLDSEILACIHKNKSRIIKFLDGEGYFEKPDSPNIEVLRKEFTCKYSIEFWRKVIYDHI